MKTIIRDGKTIEINDDACKVGDIWKDDGKIFTLKLYSYPGYDKCPVCNSEETFHRARIKEDHRLPNALSRVIPTFDGQIFMKQDICLKCGSIWAAQTFVWQIQNANVEKK